MRGVFAGGLSLLAAVVACSTAEAQTLKMMKSLDAPHYDGQRTTWSPTSDIVNMFQDTLVALDWDGKTAIPYQEQVMGEHLWMPVMNIAMYTTSLKKMKGVRPHMLYQNTFYKGLDYSF